MVMTMEKCEVCGRPLRKNNARQVVRYCSQGLCKASKNKKGREKIKKLLIQSTQRRKRDEAKCRNDSKE